ncbi:transcriptional activator domain-containing protein [Desulfocicer vacuolatum DSM 3385]|uniref:Transcriptional activator domain-containing protein n=1 Tax=Desulfocicer vacuolatum DSM 3385 TaxID=1121400 RepID=A0A1W2EBG1_9BACT|nr:BTAD domain-containing putative transcriptional regulator [Desulfocicer vacuolatum]SMD07094.1 transcriptional activator domain-containing protein [Desulfocicer vacuolatum DSM 3385]
MNQYRPPHISNIVHRQRLFTLLDTHFHKQTVIISGQAAQGKSTLVASYLALSREKVLWFHLSPNHGDHSKLFDLLFQGIKKTGMEAQSGTVHGDIPHTTLGTDKAFLRHFEGISVMLRHIPRPLILVLDDFESLEESSSGFQLIKELLNQRFDKLKIFILSRTIPPLPMPRFKMEQNIAMLTNEDLAFTIGETRQFFSQKNNMDTGDIEKIQKITQGWAGGLTLVFQCMDRFKNIDNLPDRLSWEVFSFFSQEIYQTLTRDMQSFLMKTAVLDTIDPGAALYISHAPGAFDVLKALEKKNLFIQRIDFGGKGPAFKYHKLFREFLLQDLLKTKGAQTVEKLNRRAGQFYWNKRDHEQAMDYFIKAHAFCEIADIIKIKGTDYLIKQKMSRLKKRMDALPREMTQNDPWLLFFLTMTRRIQGGKKNIRDLKRAIGIFEENKDTRGILLGVGYLIEAAVFIRQPSRNILEWIKKGEKQLRGMDQKNRYPWARSLLWQQMGLGYIAGNGNIPKGISACKNAMLLGRQINNEDLVLNASITLTFGYVQAGDFANARKMLSKIKNLTSEGRHPEYRALKAIVGIDFALKNGQFDAARELLKRSEADIEKFGLIFLYPGFVEAKALYLLYTGQFNDARQMADHLNDFSLLEGNTFYKGISHRIKALSHLREKACTPAEQEINLALDALAQVPKGDIHYFLTRQLAGIILFHNKAHARARELLEPVLNYFQSISSDLCACETQLILGLSAWELDDPETAFFHLKNGYDKACRENYDFFPLIGETLLIKAIVLLTAHGQIQPLAPYPLSLMQNTPPEKVFLSMEQMSAPCSKTEKNKRLENLHPLYKQLLPKIRIKTLGQFTIQCNDKTVDHKTLGGSKPLLLLKAIVCHGSREIPKEILIDNLWPEATAKAGEKNFKINLHRLRKALEPQPIKEFGHSYIIQKSGLISLDGELVSLDVDEFMAAGTRAMEEERKEQFKAALGYYDHAMKLYKGDYFNEEPYVEWMARKRDLFKARFMEWMQKKARLHEELDQRDSAISTWHRILGMDACFESAYRNLMILHADGGEKNKAMEIFKRCRDTLQKELSTQPGPQTMGLYDQIISR